MKIEWALCFGIPHEDDVSRTPHYRATRPLEEARIASNTFNGKRAVSLVCLSIYDFFYDLSFRTFQHQVGGWGLTHGVDMIQNANRQFEILVPSRGNPRRRR